MNYVPDQELFDYMYSASQEMGFDTYDHLPMQSENAEYPFVNIGDVQQLNIANKTAIGAELHITLNVWGNAESRFTVSQMSEKLAELANRVLITDHFRFVGRPSRTDKQIITDTSVPDTVLKHGIVMLVFNLG
ncbi:MAG: DUF3168 domain-containing protein [Limosilactobacillus oris]|jgi:hypothetical protein|uniref:hypothetical protein n=1 Tax=Limosilactobacillus oris TaxID=1632 RepID=UPI00242BAFFC|nr:hypothetical protein [Limosilactobacillus oris]MCH3911500.1 DUF3168 domain-containing protein [Limosilactobacillus oris]MCH3938750.1 DUF3168 domain-containing protein [Limosilactobacillus oris]MCI1980122.1 DUF3168 domain-containing protein [Limosilactobacillus oris]MCI2042880.1 DUF3168 domain-containing protein [Limosilactobacillus oris]